MIVPPAAAHVASSTSDGIAVADDCSHGCGGMPTQPRIVLKTPGRARVVEELPEQHRDDRRDDDRQVGERAVEALAAAHLAHEHRHEDRQREPEDEREQREVQGVEDRGAEQRVVQHVRRSCRGRPTRRVIRFVFWKLMTTDCTIGDQLKIAKTRSIGARKSERREAAAAHPGARGSASRVAAQRMRAAARCVAPAAWPRQAASR